MKQLYTLLICLVLSIQFGFGQCELTVDWGLNIADNGTANCTDDIFTVWVIVSGTNTGNEGWIAIDNQGWDYSGHYNEIFALGPISPLLGTYEALFKDASLSNCETTVSVPLDNPNCEGGSTIYLSLGDVEACAGEEVCIPFTVDEAANVLGFNFSASYDSEKLDYAGAQNFNPLLAMFNSPNIGNPSAGVITGSWNDPNGVGISLPAEVVLVEFCFVATADFETSTIISFADTPWPIEFVDGNELALTPVLTNGQVSPPITITTPNLLLLDNGTPSLCSDDSFRLEILVENTDDEATTWHAYDENEELLFSGAYGEILEIGPFPIYEEEGERYVLSFVVEDGEANCSRYFELAAPETELCACTLALELISYTCEDNGTPFNPFDDLFYAFVEVSGSTNGWTTDNPGFPEGVVDNGAYEFGPYPAADGPNELIIIKEGEEDCSASISLFDPSCNPFFCEMEVDIQTSSINDNATPNLCSDDTYTLTVQVNALGVEPESVWRLVLDNGSFAGSFPYEEEVIIDFLPVYDNLGHLNTGFTIVDATNLSCTSFLDTSNLGTTGECNCEAFLSYTEVGLNDNGTPFDCTDDFTSVLVEANFIAPVGAAYTIGLDNSIVHFGTINDGEIEVEVPNDGAHVIWLNDTDDGSCTDNIPIQATEVCDPYGSPFSLSLGSQEACVGQQFCIPVVAHQFVDILSFILTIGYDDDLLSFIEAQNFSPLFADIPDEIINSSSPGELRVLFFEPALIGHTLPENEILFELCFESNINPSSQSTTPLFFDTSAGPEVLNGEEQEIIPSLLNGQITCNCFADEECNLLQGQVLTSGDCLSGEIPLANWLIEFSNENYLEYRQSDADGNYSIYLPQGDFNIKLIPSTAVWASCQPEGYNVAFSTTGETQNLNLLAQATEDCALLEVEMSMGTMRRCFEDQLITINYENVGTVPLDDGFIGLLLPAELSYSTSSDVLIGTSGDTLIFAPNLPLGIGSQGQFQVYVDVSCEAELNSTLCATAFSLPYQTCPTPDDNWSGASLLVTGECTEEDVVFSLKNVGDSPLSLGNSYIIIQDGVMLFQVPESIPPLLPDASTEISFTADGTTYRIEATQEPFHPGLSYPTAVVEGCGTNEDGESSTGFVDQFPNDDENVFVDEDCQIVNGSYDPNDKQAEPLGYGDEHYILPEQLLEYTVRFQNTGNDTAFTVVIRDTLSDWLDMQTFQPGVSSHAYELSLDTAHAVSFIFNDILLPDSTTNLVASQGFVTYKVRPKSATPLETRIENTAAIYFDFNEPIITNTTYHRLGEDFVDFINRVDYFGESSSWAFFPNPVKDHLTVRNKTKKAASCHIFDALGHEKITGNLYNEYHTISLQSLTAGWYLVKIIGEDGQLLASEKLIRL